MKFGTVLLCIISNEKESQDMYVRMYASWINARTYVRMYECMYVRTYVFLYIAYVCTFILM